MLEMPVGLQLRRLPSAHLYFCKRATVRLWQKQKGIRKDKSCTRVLNGRMYILSKHSASGTYCFHVKILGLVNLIVAVRCHLAARYYEAPES